MSVCNVSFMTVFFIYGIASICATELLCYQCGIKDDKSDACELTIASRPSSISIVQCPSNASFCSTTTSRQPNGELKLEATRGCAARVTVNGKKHQLGCSTDKRTGAKVCYCDHYLCNHSITINRNTFLLATTLSIIVSIYFLRTKF